MDDRTLMETAVQAREYSYSPYSNFRVGAALLCADGSVYTGCNMENAAFTPGICAERTAGDGAFWRLPLRAALRLPGRESFRLRRPAGSAVR